MRGYGQFCPVAKAAEVFCERWTALILRDLGGGATRFSDLHRGVPLMSRSMLSRRLRDLEIEGIVERRPNRAGRGWTYHLTAAGREFLPIVEALGVWGQHWSRRELAGREADVGQLLWAMERAVRADALGPGRTVVQLDFPEQPPSKRRWWFVNDLGGVQLCLKDPGFGVDLYLRTTLRDLIRIWRGDVSLGHAIDSGRLEVHGPSRLRRALPAWLSLHPLARIRPWREDAGNARSRRGSSHETERALDALATRLDGRLLRAGDIEYEHARLIWNRTIDRHPAAIARCSGVADVRECIDLARAAGIDVSVRGGGHNIAGTAICEGGLVIDLSGLRSVRFDARRHRFRVAPGATLADIDAATQARGLAIPSGIVSATGIAGLTLAGGFGWLSRKWGYTCDNLAAVDLVTAAGEFVHASPSENADLFWALRGGGGNFGAVTAFEFEAHPAGPTVCAGIVVHPFDRAGDVVRFYRAFTEAAPEDLTCLLLLRKAPPAPYLPRRIHDKLVAAIAACHAGRPADGARALRPLKALGRPLADTIAAKPFCEHQRLFDAAQPAGRRNHWKSEYVAAMPPAMDDLLLTAAGRITSPHSAILIMQLGGAMRRLGEDASAVGHRNAGYVVNFAASWERAPDQPHIAWARDCLAAIAPFSLGAGYLNFLTGDELAAGGARVRAAYGDSKYARLAAIKAKWDPDNLFRHNANIEPAIAQARDLARASPR